MGAAAAPWSSAAGQVLAPTVPETGGFQKFVPQELGRLTFKSPGRYQLEVHATAKPRAAVMDLREVKLVPSERGTNRMRRRTSRWLCRLLAQSAPPPRPCRRQPVPTPSGCH